MTDQPPDDAHQPKPRTWGAFKAAMEAAGVQDDDEIFYIDSRGYQEESICRSPNGDGTWRFSVG